MECEEMGQSINIKLIAHGESKKQHQSRHASPKLAINTTDIKKMKKTICVRSKKNWKNVIWGLKKQDSEEVKPITFTEEEIDVFTMIRTMDLQEFSGCYPNFAVEGTLYHLFHVL
ncbi:unnamed protein product [Cuscuta epithymum]|uniref:Uncharacterized protein n=1 Tax=Cuscuta epithymum TaxID=186058 RepID=A0AAV0E2Y0_9ASTE|nr:unnamed protein product [Cuscuta epithymum]